MTVKTIAIPRSASAPGRGSTAKPGTARAFGCSTISAGYSGNAASVAANVAVRTGAPLTATRRSLRRARALSCRGRPAFVVEPRRMNMVAFAGALVVAVATLCEAVSANPAGSQLRPDQLARLRAIGAPVAVPGYVPAGFRLTSVDTHPCPRGVGGASPACRFGPQYVLRYVKGAASFDIEGTNGGIGDTGDDYRMVVRNAVYGPVTLYFGTGRHGFGAEKPAPPAMTHTAQPRLISEWIGRQPFYHLIGANVVPSDAAKVLASLRPLR